MEAILPTVCLEKIENLETSLNCHKYWSKILLDLEAIRQMKLCSVGGARGCLGLIN
jgi:hypothetical protein